MLETLTRGDAIAQIKANFAKVRKWFVVVALVLMVVIVAFEAGAPLLAPARTSSGSAGLDWGAVQDGAGGVLPAEVIALINGENSVTDQLTPPAETPPGWGVRSLAFVDAVTLLTILLIAASHVVPAPVVAKSQGVITLVAALLLLLAAFIFLLLVVVQLFVMIGLLLAIPFGTLIYLITYGFFDRGGAGVLLSWLFGLKLLFGLALVAASERYLQNVGLVLAVLSTLLASIVVSFLHGIVPIILVSITDAIAALIVAVIAIVWAIVLLIGAILSILALARSPLGWLR
jgi:VanZ family protein